MTGVPDASAMVCSYQLLSKNKKRLLKNNNENDNDLNIRKKLTEKQEEILGSIEKQLLSEKLPESERRCPECGRQFAIIKFNDDEIDCCVYCKSYWFDADELKGITGTTTDVPSETERSRKSKYHCPVCEEIMKEYIYLKPDNLLVDKCPNNHGVYLESGELKRAFYALNR